MLTPGARYLGSIQVLAPKQHIHTLRALQNPGIHLVSQMLHPCQIPHDHDHYLSLQTLAGRDTSRQLVVWHGTLDQKLARHHVFGLHCSGDLSLRLVADADLTFQPKISRKSQMIMADTRGAAGGSGFLDRLKNDLRRREQKQKVWHGTHCSYNAAIAFPATAQASSLFPAAVQEGQGVYRSQRFSMDTWHIFYVPWLPCCPDLLC